MKTLTFLIVSLVASVSFANDADHKVTNALQETAVTIKAGGAEGSGVLISRGDRTYVLTAGHVVEGCRKTRKVIKDGIEKTLVEFDDITVIKVFVEDGRTVGKQEMTAEVIKYSDADNGHDVGLLMIRKKNFSTLSVNFCEANEFPALGDMLIHVGSMLGQSGSNSYTQGVLSQLGRMIGKMEYLQTSCTAFPGSSGCGIYTKSGKYVGMLVRGAGETFNLVTPIQRLKVWSEKAKMEWLFDASKPVPSEKELRAAPIED